MRRRAVCLAALFAPLPAFAACPQADAVAELAARMAALQPARSFGPGLSLADGACGRDRLIGLLTDRHGPVVGWKAGLTAPAMQRRFGVSHPVRGALLRDMLLPDGATVPARYGAVPVFESDLLVRVKDKAIIGARDHMAILRHLDAVIPFLELADLVLADGELLDAANMLAINVGARAGVVGPEVPVVADRGFADRLAAMRVILTDHTGQVLADSPGSAIMGHPLDAVAWLVADLARAGTPVRAGDLFSLGSFSPFGRPAPGHRITARYVGLAAGPVSVSVAFR